MNIIGYLSDRPSLSIPLPPCADMMLLNVTFEEGSECRSDMLVRLIHEASVDIESEWQELSEAWDLKHLLGMATRACAMGGS
jgi:hypothetical protein